MNLLLRYIPLGLLIVLFLLLLRRRAYAFCPLFFAYVAFGVTADVARLIARLLLNREIYPTIYWVTEAGYDLLGILVMYELIHRVLRNLAYAWWHRLIFPAALLSGIFLSIARVHAVPPHFSHGLAFYAITGEIGIRFVEVLAVPLILIPLFGVPGNRYPLGIAAGFGLYSTVALVVTTRFSDIGPRFSFVWGVASLVAYSVAVVVWIWAFSVPRSEEFVQTPPGAPNSFGGPTARKFSGLRASS